MKVRIQRMCAPERPDVRAYFSHEQLTAQTTAAERGQDDSVDDPVLDALIRVPGVVVATVMPYAVSILKSPSHDWEEIEPSVLRLLSAFNLDEGQLLSAVEEGE